MGFERFGRNLRGRDFLCGDIHGRFDLLDLELKRARFDYACDRLFCVGDLVDRGAGSHLAHLWLRENWFHSVRGNHEQFIFDWMYGLTDRAHHEKHGGAWWYELSSSTQRHIAKVFADLPFAIELETARGKLGIVHAEVFGDWRMYCETLSYDLGPIAAADLFRRKRWREKDCSLVTGVDGVVVGHVIVDEVALLGNTLYIDTGAYRTEKLTLIEAEAALSMITGKRLAP